MNHDDRVGTPSRAPLHRVHAVGDMARTARRRDRFPRRALDDRACRPDRCHGDGDDCAVDLDGATTTQRLGTMHRGAVREHLLRLDAEDRRMRFLQVASDTTVAAYADSIDFAHATCFGVFSAGVLVCLAQAIPFEAQGQRHVEAAFSTDRAFRRRGLARAALDSLQQWCAAQGTASIVLHCDTRNVAMRALLRAHAARELVADGEVDASIDVRGRPAPQ